MPHVKATFMFVKKWNKMKGEIKKKEKWEGAMKIKGYKRCLQSVEEGCRGQRLEGMEVEQVVEMVKIQHKVNNDDFSG